MVPFEVIILEEVGVSHNNDDGIELKTCFCNIQLTEQSHPIKRKFPFDSKKCCEMFYIN